LIGKPIANANVLVLDPSGQACPPGVPGELCVGGRGLARGYLGAPELTAKKFTTDTRVGRLYHTGDLARWLPDGNLEFLGRIDSQVKLRGYRIELGEIEQAMLGADGVNAAVVIDRDDAAGDKYLAGFYVGAASAAGLRAHLATSLPDYMVPAVLVELDAIPMTANGKVDRKRLPEPQLEARTRVIEPPSTPAEQIVVEAFAKALGRADVGATDDFFELGGNSLKAVAVVAALASDFRITTNDLFRLRSARAIGAEIPMIRGDLKARLITLVSDLRGDPGSDPLDELAPELARYRERYQPYRHVALREHMAYRDVLLTGATGFLGGYLLRDLLERTDAKVHVTMRARKRQDAWDRLVEKTSRYFGRGFLDRHARRIHLVLGDLVEPQFGLDRQAFDALARTVDCVLHSAALTKHYGELSRFVKANVDATSHVCDLAYRAGCDLNVVSTVSVGGGEIAGKKRALFTEFDCDIGQLAANHYVRTKLDGEKVVHALRDKGLACNIFRVGFLTGDSKTLTFQSNADDSGFVQTLQSYLALRKIPTTAFAQSFCPVDEVSDAIMRLMSASSLLDQTHHVDRMLGADEAEAIIAGDSRCEPMTEDDFYEWLAARVDDREIGPAATAMLLHQGLLEDRVATETITVREKTDSLLTAAGFAWRAVRPEQIWSLTGRASS
jgi:thioester reductase-like protein